MSWIDTDLIFTNENWAEETLSKLQTYDVLQLFTHCIDLGPNNETMQVHKGLAYQYCRGVPPPKKLTYGPFFHPGYSWVITRKAFDAIGGLIDWAILGSADSHMAMAFIGRAHLTLSENLNADYKRFVLKFQERCEKNIKRNLGYVNGTILHEWHGSKRNRFYKERWKILIDNDYSPLEDLKRDAHGLWQLEDTKFKLRDDIRNYFRSRNEDSIDWEEALV